MRNKTLTSLLAIFMAACLIAGCSGGSNNTATTAAPTTAAPAATTAAAPAEEAAPQEEATTAAEAAAPAETTAAAVATTAAAPAETEAAAPAEEAAPARAIKTFVSYGLSAPQWNSSNNWDDPIGTKISEITGVKLVGESPVGDWTEALTLMIASNDLPDIISSFGNSRQLLYDAGAIRPLKSLIMNSPNIVAFYGDDIGRLAYSYDDREFYSFGTARLDSEYVPDSHWEFGYFAIFPVLEAAGYPNLKTPYDFERIITEYLADHPTTAEGLPMYGMSFWIGDNWRHSFLNGITDTAGLPGDTIWYIDQDNWEVTSIFRHPAAKQYIGWLNHLNDVGLMDPELVTQSKEMLIEKISNGQVAGIMHAKWLTWEAAEYLPESNPKNDTLGFPLRWDPDNTQWRDQQSRGNPEGIGYSITTAVNDEDTQLLVDFFDFLVSDEGQQLQAWGIEGEHYTFDQNDTSKDWKSDPKMYVGDDPRGPRRLSPEVWNLRYEPDANRVDLRNETGIDKYGSQIFGSRFVTNTGLLLNDYQQDADYYFSTRHPDLQTVLTAYGIKSEKELFPRGYPCTIDLPSLKYGPSHTLPTGSTSEAHLVASQQYLEAIPVELSKLVVTPASRFDEEWDNFISMLENRINIKMLEDEMTMLLRQRLSMWYDE